jgi:hypothetical protein
MNGDIYEGEWWQDFMHGWGKFITNDGIIYEGKS